MKRRNILITDTAFTQIDLLRGERGDQGKTIGVVPKYQMSTDGQTWHDTVRTHDTAPNPAAIRVSYDDGQTWSPPAYPKMDIIAATRLRNFLVKH